MADLPEGRGVLTSLLLSGMGNTVMQESIFHANGSGGVAIASVMFIVQILTFLTVSILLSAFHTKLHKRACYILFTLVLQHTGAVVYFVGDNIVKIITRYGGEVEAAQNAGAVLTVIALLIFWITPSLGHLIRETPLTEGESTEELEETDRNETDNQEESEETDGDEKEIVADTKHWGNALDTITVFVKVDVLYTAVLGMVGMSESACDASIPIFIVCLLIGMFYIAVKITVLWYDKKPAIKFRRVVAVVLMVIIGAVSFPVHLLMNNSLPLDCAFTCPEAVVNSTTAMTNDMDPCSGQFIDSAWRLSLTLINLLFLTFVSLLFGSAYLIYRFNGEDFKKLLPKCCDCDITLFQGTEKELTVNWFYAWMVWFTRLLVDFVPNDRVLLQENTVNS